MRKYWRLFDKLNLNILTCSAGSYTKRCRNESVTQWYAHKSSLFKSPRILTLDDMLKLNPLESYYRYVLYRCELPPYFNCFNTRVEGDSHSYETRNPGQLHVGKNWISWQIFALRIRRPMFRRCSPTIVSGISPKIQNTFQMTNKKLYAPPPWLLYISANLNIRYIFCAMHSAQ